MIACIVASVGTLIIYAISNGISESKRERGFRNGQIASASWSPRTRNRRRAEDDGRHRPRPDRHSFGFGKRGSRSAVLGGLSCAGAIALGTWIGGWRIIRTLGKGLVEIQAPQGMAAEASSAAIILTSSAAGMALSTIRWPPDRSGQRTGQEGRGGPLGVAGRMAVAWITTFRSCRRGRRLCYWLASLIGGAPGAIVIFLILAGSPATCTTGLSSRR
ncbi:inorganic phosphate transporter [Gordonia sp. YC-JH1]|uniref:inorganic phosphate transporter n=1 Tax=Gordonia sp. YC-JH1 TaxID=2059875 RepID=UPI003FA39DFB